MLDPHGPIVADPSVPASAWVAAFPPERAALVLAPASATGWFGGLELVACDPELHAFPDRFPARPYDPTPNLERAGALLDRALHARVPLVAAALLGYEGDAIAAVFRRGLVRTAEGWRAWGDWREAPPPRPVPAAAFAPGEPLATGVESDTGREAYRSAVEAAREAMRAGDVYVLNLCRTLTADPAAEAHVLFASLLERSRPSMAASWRLPDRAVLSASPERFLRLDGRALAVQPVKGTRPRGLDTAADADAIRDLATSEKERAEHVMVVDLERNDIGRACAPGSVCVPRLMRVETTPYCHQMVSSVEGVLPASASASELLAATFPCGSVTGAPKRSAMAHIARLECGGRAEYTGSLVVAMPGRLDSSVMIRTAVIAEGRLRYGVGCGITVDSDPAAEWEETLVKALPLLGRRD
jgi:para-aminobenzoate synthetase component I